MFNSKVLDTLLSYISDDVDLDYVVYVSDIYGLAYNKDKSILKIYIVEDIANMSIGSFTLCDEEILNLLGCKFFTLSFKDKFEVLSDVLNSYYLMCEGGYTPMYLRSELLKAIEKDCCDGDTFVVDSPVAFRLNKEKNNLYLYNIKNKDEVITIDKKDIKGVESIYLLLGYDFLHMSSKIQIELVKEYFNTLC